MLDLWGQSRSRVMSLEKPVQKAWASPGQHSGIPELSRMKCCSFPWEKGEIASLET